MALSGPAAELVAMRESSTSGRERTYKRTFLVRTTSPKDDPGLVKTAIGIPQQYFPYVTSTFQDVQALARSINARPKSGSPYHWEVEVSYSNQGSEEEEEDENPLARPADITWSFETVQSPLLGERVTTASNPNGSLYTLGAVNSAGEPYDPPATYDESRPVVNIVRNEAAFNPALALDYQNAINSDTFAGVLPGQAKMRQIGATRQVEGETAYWRVTYTIAFRWDKWDLRLLNYGSYYRTAAGSTTFKWFENTGVRYLGLLSTDGTAIASSDTPTYKTYKVHREKSFASLSLPLTR